MKKNLLTSVIILIFISALQAQQPKWKIVGNETFPQLESKWKRSTSVSGIGQIKSIYADPKDKSHLIIGAYGGGVWETFNALSPDGSNVKWTCLSNEIPIGTAGQIKVHNDYLYASSSSKISTSYSSSLFDKYGLGVVKKHKDSTHWEVSSFKFDCKYFDVILHNNQEIIYAVSKNKVYKSIDNGVNWIELTGFNSVFENPKDNLHEILINPENPNEVFVFATVSKALVYSTIDGGITWKDQTDIFDSFIHYDFRKNSSQCLPYYDAENKELFIALHTGNKVFIIATKDWENFKLYNTSNEKGLRVSTMTSTDFIKINETDFLFGATKLHGLYNGETSKTLSSYKIHDDIRALAKNDDIVYIGHDGGIAITKDFGKTYTNISGNLNLFQSFNMAYNNYNNHRIITIGVQDGSWYRIDRDGENQWEAVPMCCEGGVFTQPNNPNITYINNKGRLIRLDNGVNYPLGKKNKVARIEDFDAPIAFHPTKPETLVLSEFKWPNSELLISYNKGQELSHISIDDTDKGYMRGRPSAMAYDKTNSDVFYFSSLFFTPKTSPNWVVENHLYKTTNMNDTPEDVFFYDIIENIREIDSEVLDRSPINDIEVYQDHIWVCFGNVQDHKKIYYSNDAGENWNNISYNLGNFPANRILYDANQDLLLLGTDTGVYRLKNKKWECFGVGLPKASVTDLEIDAISNELIVSLYGRSVWFADLSAKNKSATTTTAMIITEDTIWTTNRVINGDLIIANKARLTILNSNLTLKNIVVEKEASLVWNGGRLTSYKSPLQYQKSILRLEKKSCMSLKNMLVEDVDIQLGRKVIMEQKNLKMKNCNVLKF